MKRILILVFAFTNIISANCQDNKKLWDYFPDINMEDTVLTTTSLRNYYYNKSDSDKLIDSIALKYFFDNNIKNMEYIDIGYNVDENTYIYTPFIKKVFPLYKIHNKNTYILCYVLKPITYFAIYDYENDKIGNTFVISEDADGGDDYTYSTIFSNNYIATVKMGTTSYYILSKIDYETQKFIELKKIEIDNNQSNYTIMNNVFEALGISKTGELLEDNP
jgi:hypothetical protein